MTQISYKPRAGKNTESVYLDGKHVGSIRLYADGFRYCPKGSIGKGESFATMAACKASLVEGAA